MKTENVANLRLARSFAIGGIAIFVILYFNHYILLQSVPKFVLLNMELGYEGVFCIWLILIITLINRVLKSEK